MLRATGSISSFGSRGPRGPSLSSKRTRVSNISAIGRNSTRMTTSRGFYGKARVPPIENEPILGYRAGSPEQMAYDAQLKEMKSQVLDIPLIIGGQEVRTGDLGEVRIPHDHQHVIAKFHRAGEKEVKASIDAALNAKAEWEQMPLEHRMSIFLKAADLLADSKWRQRLNAATTLNQSKNRFQAEIDSACEMVDFLRFNVQSMEKIYSEQPFSPTGVWNRQNYRPLEGFIYAVTPFNFTAIAGNLTTAPAMMGNTVLWKPSNAAVYSGYQLMKLFEEAGLPPGVINFCPGEPAMVSDVALNHRDFAGLHYTGSSAVFRNLWSQIGQNIGKYRSFPRIVGETGGKDFIFAHSSADVNALAVAMVRGAFEYAGQKCSAASRTFIPKSIWPAVLDALKVQMEKVKMGNPEDPTVLVNAVIHEASFEKATSYLKHARESPKCKILFGGESDKSVGYFVEPTIVQVEDPMDKLMLEEIFAPILAVYVYEDDKFDETLKMCDESTEYALTGAIFAQDRKVLAHAESALRHSCGNMYLNDKPTGAVVNQQPFGGGRGSGTNDKSGSYLNLLRWTSTQVVKENFVPPTDVLYPYMTDKY